MGLAFSALKIASFVKDAAAAGARYETLGIVLEQVGKNAGYSAQDMHKYADGVKNAGIQMDTARQVTVRMAQAQIDLSKSQQLARIAQDTAVIGNINSSEALERMIHGIQTAQTDVLRTIGINVSFEESYAKLAAQLGVTSNSLSQHQKMTARTNAVMEEGAKSAGVYEKAMETAGKQLTSFSRYVNDFAIEMGTAFNPATAEAVGAATAAMKEFTAVVKEESTQNALKILSSILASFVSGMSDKLVKGVAAASAALELLDNAVSATSYVYKVGLVEADKYAAHLIHVATNATKAREEFAEREGEDSWMRVGVQWANELTLAMDPVIENLRKGREALVLSEEERAKFEKKMQTAYESRPEQEMAELKKNIAYYKQYYPEKYQIISEAEAQLKKVQDEVAESANKAVEKEKKAQKERKDLLAEITDEYKKLTLSTEEYERFKVHENYMKQTEALKGTNAELEETARLQYLLIDQKYALQEFTGWGDVTEQQILEEQLRVFKRERDEEIEIAKKTEDELKKIKKESLEKQEKAYEDFASTVQDYTADIIADWDNMGDTMIKIIKRTLAEIAASLISQTLVLPIAMQVGSAVGASWNGVPMSSMPGGSSGSGIGIGDIFSLGKNVYGIASGGNPLLSGTMADVGSSIFGNTAWYGSEWAAGTLGYGGAAAAGAAFVPATEALVGTLGYGGMAAAGTGAAAGAGAGAAAAGATSGIAAGAAMAIPYIGLAIAAAALIMGMSGDEPTPAIGIQGGKWDEESPETGSLNSLKYNYKLFAQDMGGESSAELRDFFDARFAVIDAQLSGALEETFKNYDAGAKDRGWVYTEGMDMEAMIGAVSDNVFEGLLEGLKKESVGAGFEDFGVDFFQSLKQENQDLFDSFVHFYTVVEGTEDFLVKFDRQMELLGGNTLLAFQNMEEILNVFTAMDAMIDPLSEIIDPLVILIDQFNSWTDVLEEAKATLDELAKAEEKRVTALGLQLTGLSAQNVGQSITGAITGVGDIKTALNAIIGQSIAVNLGNALTEDIMETAILPFVDKVGKAFTDSGDDMEKVFAILPELMAELDLSGSTEKIAQFADVWDKLFNAEEKAAEAAEQLANAAESLVESTRSDYVKSLNSALDTANTEQAKLLENLTNAEQTLADVKAANEKKVLDDRLEALGKERDVYQQSMQDADDRLQDLKRASEQIKDYMAGMLTGQHSYLLPDQMLAAAQAQFASSTSENMTDAANTLLSSARAALTDPKEYEAIFAAVQSRLSGEISVIDPQIALAQEQVDAAELQVALLEEEIAYLSKADETLMSLDQATLEYQKAKMEFDESQWDDQISFYEAELERLDGIENATLSVSEALAAYQSALTAAIAGGYDSLDSKFAAELAALQGSQSAPATPYVFPEWAPESETTPFTPTDSTLKSAAELYADSAFFVHPIYGVQRREDYPGFAAGGISTGPTSGYMAELHGTEAVIPLAKGYIPIKIESQEIDPELKELLKDLIKEVRADKILSKRINRILDRVTAGEDSFRTRAAV
jgi:hypothetical protein